jgi:broad specificity phosphatase PhoE
VKKDRTELVEKDHPKLSIRTQCELLDVPRSSLDYRPVAESEDDLRLMRLMDEIYLVDPCIGTRRLVEVLERDHGEVFRQWRADVINFRCPEAENFIDLRERIVPTLEELVAAFPGKRLAVVCHAGPIRVALAHALGMPLENIFRLNVNYCGIHVIEYPEGKPPRVALMNG